MSLTKQETAGGFQGRLDDDENDDEILKYIASPDTLEDSRMGTSPLSTSHRAAVSELKQVLEMAWFPKHLQGTFPCADGNIGIIINRWALSEL
jgi:hypothetical protein